MDLFCKANRCQILHELRNAPQPRLVSFITMKNINSKRVFRKNINEPDPDGDYVLYWMQINRRFHYNFALEYAVGWANKLGKPLLIFEAISCDYPWATVRAHTFIMQGMKEHLEYAENQPGRYLSFVEGSSGQYESLLVKLAQNACILITDEYPVFIMRERNKRLPEKLGCSYFTVDSNGLIPLGLTDKAPYSAYIFRKTMQRYFMDSYTNPPENLPLDSLENLRKPDLPDEWFDDLPSARQALDDIPTFTARIDIDQQVQPIAWKGTRAAGLGMLGRFIQNGLMRYGKKRNEPDEDATSNLSPWLHFGKISEFEVVRTVLNEQPENWELDQIVYNKGSRDGFFNGDENIDAYLDEVITWRETGFHHAHHEPDYDRYESLPEWARTTLDKHRSDPREWIYELDEFIQARTHDEVWNAAQNQLRTDGLIHNYLRMLWGKKILEWTPDPETAIEIMIEMNNRFAIDGRDPNSYSGIFWCLGRFDRAWQERPIYGKIRYMTSESARKKLDMEGYLKKYS